MLSRRNVRVKVMQALYAGKQSPVTERAILRSFGQMVSESYQTLLFELYLFTRVLHEAREAQKRRAARLRPSEQDLAFRSHIYDNPVILSLVNSAELAKAAETYKFDELVDETHLRGFYDTVATIDEYDDYATAPEHQQDVHLAMVLRAHKALIDNDAYTDYLEDRFARWQEDKSLVVGAAKKILKAQPTEENFLFRYEPDEDTVAGFGQYLLRFVLENDERLLGYIEPVLRNWDKERVAVLDMILLKMALGELLEFQQIPPKVTLNEYVELAKTYSTDKSKEFINGILDKLLHSLTNEGLIVKKGRGLIE